MCIGRNGGLTNAYEQKASDKDKLGKERLQGLYQIGLVRVTF